MISLRPYQNNAVQNSVDMIFERGNSLIVAGTGAGKTIMMAAAIGRFCKGFKAINKRLPHVLVLVHRTEIHGQNLGKFKGVCSNIGTSEITAGRKSLHGHVHFGMVQTVANLIEDFARDKCFFDLIVIDEAHHSAANTYENIIKANSNGSPSAALMGVTATPNRGDKMPLVHLFDNFYQITTKFLMDAHYLVRPTFIDLSPMFATDKGPEIGKLSKNCKDDAKGNELLRGLCMSFLKNKENGKSIIFAPSHEFCIRICNILSETGIKTAYLALGLDEITRKEELERFEKGDCEVLVNVDICTEGYDFPPLRNIVEFDTNGTHGQWVQKVGRVLRTCEGKTSCTVIDFGGNVQLYPDGVETSVNLEGAVRNEKGKGLVSSSFFRSPSEEKATAKHIDTFEAVHTPYNAPTGFESLNDTDLGIVWVACNEKNDCIIVENKSNYHLFLGDKESLEFSQAGSFHHCITQASKSMGHIACNETKPISKLQVQLLAPEFPTNTLNWYGANCCICWKLWRDVVKGAL